MIAGRSAQEGNTTASLARERDALKWLFSFADMERGVGWNPAAAPDEQWRLGRTRALLDLAGAPDRGMRCVLIAGTKGKGSTAAFLASLLCAGGVRAGLYTQPHLQVYRERIRVDGVMVGPADFAAAVDRWRPRVARLRERHPGAGEPTTFEITTALAIGLFADAGCSVAVLEVGLGGRLDATNAVEPEISILATIDRGHTAILGTTLERIAREKAGILRRDRTALVARQRPSVRRTLVTACRDAGALCAWIEPLPPATTLGIAGTHQRQNAALAVAAARGLGVPIVMEALERVRWPGRIETLERDGSRIVLDGAHDPASARALADELAARRERSIALVIGMYRDKEASRILRPLLSLAARVFVTRPAGPRALPVADLATMCRALTRRAVETHADVGRAIEAARSRTDGRTICVAGSLALVGQARDHLGLAPPERLWTT